MTAVPQHVASTPIAVPTAEEGPRVETTSGPVRALWREIVSAPDRVGPEPLRTRSAAFYGIPYAEAPTGERRLMAPVPRAPWTEERPAVVPAATPQRGSIFADPAIPEPSVPGDDVLTLNVFTPAPGDESAALPVYVWIHGGGWTSGSHNSPWYDGAAFNRDGIVTVSVAYRLGFDGYGWVPGSDAPWNRGVLDQVLALEWVRDNISRFGGDPARVTIGGQSAGGGNCVMLLGVPRARGLFHAVISESGAVPGLSVEAATASTRALADSLGVPATLEGFRSRTYDEIVTAQNALGGLIDNAQDGGAGQAGPDPVQAIAGVLENPDAPTPGIPFCPTIDGEVIPEGMVEAMEAGRGAAIPVLFGSTTHDFAFSGLAYEASASGRDPRGLLLAGGLDEELADAYLARHPEHAAAPHLIVGDLISDATFHMPIVRWLLARQAHRDATGHGAGGWAYEFDWRHAPMGMALHCDEVPFAFDCLLEPYCEHTLGAGAPQALADAVHGAWVRFIRTGEPGWEEWAPRSVGCRFGSGGLAETPRGAVAEDVPVYAVERAILASRA